MPKKPTEPHKAQRQNPLSSPSSAKPPSSSKPHTTAPSNNKPDSTMITDHQDRVYALLRQIPKGKVTTYAALAQAAKSSPRAVGGALRNNPFAPETPCHRCIASSGTLGGFRGTPETAVSGLNREAKMKLLKDEGVEFDSMGKLKDRRRIWDDFQV